MKSKKFMFLIVMFTVLALFASPETCKQDEALPIFGSNDVNSVSYERSKMSVAVVEGVAGVGTGFLCEMCGKKYFVTNKHVANQRGRIEAFFLDGEKLRFNLDSPIDVAVNRDLVRFEIKTDRPCLVIASELPRIGDKVEFYGNAVGEKVITMTAGKILAVGMERIEIDCPIQSGNSGSPLVMSSNGRVIGVTTLSTFNKLNDDPSKVGTRYDPNVKRTREFAVRFVGVEWKRQPYRAFLKAINVYGDYVMFYKWMRGICLADDPKVVFESDLPDLKLYGSPRLNAFMKRIANCDDALKKNRDRLAKMRERNENNPGKIGGYGQTEMKNQKKRILDCIRSSYKIRRDVLADVVSHAKRDVVLSEEEQEEVVDAFDWMLRTYCEKFRRQLQGEVGYIESEESRSRRNVIYVWPQSQSW